MYNLSALASKGPQQRRFDWRETGRWLGLILFSPFVVLRALLGKGDPPPAKWIKGFLLLGPLLLTAMGVVILTSQAANQRVFASLGNFAAASEPLSADKPYAGEINAAASRYQCNPMAVYYVMQIESRGQRFSLSRRGARGLMQIMPATWRTLNPRSRCSGRHAPKVCSAGSDCIFSTWGNIRVGTLYLSQLLRTYQDDYVAVLQAYNAGQGNVIFSPRAKFAETRSYVSSFLRQYQRLQDRQLQMRLAASSQLRRMILPLLICFAFYLLLATFFFWRNHLRGY